MVWFANPVLGFAMYFPVAIAMLLLPWSHVDYSTAKEQQRLPYHALGAALFNSAVAAGLTQIGAGTAMVFALWGFAGVLVSFCLTQVCVYVCVGGRACLLCAAITSRVCTKHVHVAIKGIHWAPRDKGKPTSVSLHATSNPLHLA